MINLQKIIIGAAAGFLAAVVVDLDAYRKHQGPDPFNWSLAFGRWVSGAIAGALTGLGAGEVTS